MSDANPRYPQHPAFLRQRPMPSVARGAEQPAPTQEDKIMNQHVNRRSLVSTAAVFATASMSVDALTKTREHVEVEADVTSEIDLKIAAYRRALAEWMSLADEVDRLEELTEFLDTRVRYGNLLTWKDDQEHREPLFACDHEYIDHVCDRNASVPLVGARESAEMLRERLHRELTEIEQANDLARDASGLAVAEAKAEQAWSSYREATDAVLACRPTTVDEYRTRDAFVLEYTKEAQLAEYEVDLLFGRTG